MAASFRVPTIVEWSSGRIDELTTLGDPGSLTAAATEPDDLAVLIFTSGTTGRPKGAMLSPGNLIANSADLVEGWRLGPDDIALHTLPIFHGHGLFAAAAAPLTGGVGLLMLPRFDVDAVADHLGQATVMMGVPTFYSRLLGAYNVYAKEVRERSR
ncbi:MAG: AMP-binding protein [Acetobacteraceae bacterium]|nr:AMP-binding protein [Acetobacteraceae bacterium]